MTAPPRSHCDSTSGDTAWLLAASRTRPADGTRPGALLRRPGPLQERAQHDDDDLRVARGHLRSSGSWSATPSPSATTSAVGLVGDPTQYFGLSDLIERRAATATPAIPLILFAVFQGLFCVITGALVVRRDRGPGPVRGLDGLRRRLDAGRLRADRALGLRLLGRRPRRWLAGQRGRGSSTSPAGRRSRSARAPRRSRWRWSSGRGSGFGTGPDAAAQPDPGDARRRPAVVRLVRLQRRLGAGRQPDRGRGLHDDAAGRLRRLARLAARSSGCATATPRRSARRPAWSPDWSRSPRPAARCPRSARSSMGLVAGVVCALAVGLKYRFGYDDSLDVVGVHLVGGLVGTFGIGLIATAAAPTGRRRPVLRRRRRPARQAAARRRGGAASTRSSSRASSGSSSTGRMGFRIDEEHEVSGIDLVRPRRDGVRPARHQQVLGSQGGLGS